MIFMKIEVNVWLSKTDAVIYANAFSTVLQSEVPRCLCFKFPSPVTCCQSVAFFFFFLLIKVISFSGTYLSGYGKPLT